MDFLNFSEYFNLYFPIIVVSLLCTIAGSYWIDHLYANSLHPDLLSFPEQISSRSKFRRPLLFLLLLFCIRRAWAFSNSPALIYFIIAIVFLCFITMTDFEQYVIFDAMLLPFAAVGMVYTMHTGLPFTDHITASLGGGLLFLFLAWISKGAIGGGDIKLVAALGLWLGSKALASVILYGAIAGGIAALLLLLLQKTKRKQFIAYGPYYTLSAIGVLLKLLRVLF